MRTENRPCKLRRPVGVTNHNKLVDLLPALVEAAAKGIAGSNLTVLNGSQGVNDIVASVVGQGLTIYETLKPAIARVRPDPDSGPTEGDGPHRDTVSGPA